ncbi:MAG: hypothetical protein ACXVUE_01470 [Solirubrobacteraceae bacterium]
MTTTLNALAAQEHVHDLEREARRAHKQDADRDVSLAAIELRLARADESRVLHALAQLDDAPDLDGEALVALIDGEAVAALSLADRRVVANPFVRTRHAVTLLQIQADHLFGRRERRRLRVIPRLRFA